MGFFFFSNIPDCVSKTCTTYTESVHFKQRFPCVIRVNTFFFLSEKSQHWKITPESCCDWTLCEIFLIEPRVFPLRICFLSYLCCCLYVHFRLHDFNFRTISRVVVGCFLSWSVFHSVYWRNHAAENIPQCIRAPFNPTLFLLRLRFRKWK